jgi:hypothetical protein
MNIENIDKAINIMQRASTVNMLSFQTRSLESARIDRAVVFTEEDLHACGNSACFAGWIAVSPEWKEAGGECTVFGSPLFPDSENVKARVNSSNAIAEWLGVNIRTADLFIFGDILAIPLATNDLLQSVSIFYDKEWRSVGGEEVIAKLSLLKELGEHEFIVKYLEMLPAYRDSDDGLTMETLENITYAEEKAKTLLENLSHVQ